MVWPINVVSGALHIPSRIFRIRGEKISDEKCLRWSPVLGASQLVTWHKGRSYLAGILLTGILLTGILLTGILLTGILLTGILLGASQLVTWHKGRSYLAGILIP